MNWRDAVRGARWRAVSAGCIAAGMLWAAAGSAQTGKTVATAKAASTPTRTDSASPAASSFVDEPIPKPVGRQEQSHCETVERQDHKDFFAQSSGVHRLLAALAADQQYKPKLVLRHGALQQQLDEIQLPQFPKCTKELPAYQWL